MRLARPVRNVQRLEREPSHAVLPIVGIENAAHGLTATIGPLLDPGARRWLCEALERVSVDHEVGRCLEK